MSTPFGIMPLEEIVQDSPRTPELTPEDICETVIIYFRDKVLEDIFNIPYRNQRQYENGKSIAVYKTDDGIKYKKIIKPDWFKIATIEDVKGKCREKELIILRHLCMYFIRQIRRDMTLKGIGYVFSKRDHSTVIYACYSVQDQIDVNKKYREHVNNISVKLGIKELITFI